MESDFSCELRQLFVLSLLDGFELLPVIYWQSSGKAKKFSCILLRLEMLREWRILVSGVFI
jgi:hypothetical protein